MARYHQLGKIPKKRHVVFKNEEGGLYYEELISSEGFADNYSLVYHANRPTMVSHVGKAIPCNIEFSDDQQLKSRSLEGFKTEPKDDYLESRTPVLGNDDTLISLAAPKQSMKDYFFKNSQASEMIFIHEGSGVFKCMFGDIEFSCGDHIIIPKGTVYQLEFKDENNRLFIVESNTPYRFPSKYLNPEGQLLEHAPFYERDIRLPQNLQSNSEKGEFKIMIKRDNALHPYTYDAHPFGVIGWDGYHYPYALSIHDFEPITGRLHMPPPIHQTWQTAGFVTCAFVPRLYDYHPDSIPAPYHHSNIDSDEVLYYVDGDFMSRNNIEKGQITLHPMGIPHGPHPGATERSIGQKETQELAVMVDTFKPLKLTKQAEKIELKDYYKSWLSEK